MHPLFDPVTLVNLVLCIVIVTISVIGYVKIRSVTPLYIGAGFFLFGVSHVATLLGLKTTLETEMIIVRAFGYITVCVGVYLIIREITLRMKTAEELRTERLGLERRVDERTADLQQANEALRESEDKYRLINDAGLDFIYSYDQAGRFTSANRSLCAAFRLRTDQVLGRTHAELGFPVAQCRDWDELHRRVYETGTTVTAFTSTPTPDGVIRQYEVALNPLHDSAGAITGIAGTTHDITERKRAEEQIQQRNRELAHLNDQLVSETVALEAAMATITRIAATDDLTGLANRRCFYEALEKAVSLARRHGSPLALVSLDLDGLKRVNDSAGHEAGDGVLTSFAELLAELCRIEDLPGRLGGDEFNLLLPGIDLSGARGLAERVLAAVRSSAALAHRGVTVSGGVAQWTPGELPDDFLRRADAALYAAKRDGGDAVAGGGDG